MRLNNMERQTAIRKSIRPAITPPLIVALCLWASSALTYYFSADVDDAILFGCLCFGFLLFCVSIFCIFTHRFAALPLFTIGITLGIMSGCSAAVVMHSQQAEVEEYAQTKLEFTLIEDALEGEYAMSCLAQVKLNGKTAVKVRLKLPEGAERLGYGDVIVAFASMSKPSESNRQYYWQKGMVATAQIYSFERIQRQDGLGVLVSIRQKALSFFADYETQGAALMSAIVFGERSALNASGAYDEMKTIGLAHLVAVSGSHLVTISALLSIALKLAKVPRTATIGIQIVFVCIYLVLTAMPISAIRAACMICVTMMAVLAKRRASSLAALSMCICLMIAYCPQTALSVSFFLSVGSTLGIILFSSLFLNWLRLTRIGTIPFVGEGLALTASAQLVTIPVSGALFSQISLIAPVSNIVAIPFFVILCSGGLIATLLCFVIPTQSDVILLPLMECAQIFCDATARLASIPYACIPCDIDALVALGITVLAVFMLWALWPQPSLRLLIAVCAVASVVVCSIIFLAPRIGEDEIIMLDVGQGDAFIVQSKGEIVLIDTGNRDAALLAALARHGVYHLDAIIISHSDDDHMGSLEALENIVQVDTVYVAQPTPNCPCEPCTRLMQIATQVALNGEVGTLKVGDRVELGNFVMTVIWPDSFSDRGGNVDSLTLLLTKMLAEGVTYKALFCGDAEMFQLKEMIQIGRLSDIDILKVGHHASKQTIDDDTMRILSPEVSLLSVGVLNRYGHPARETIDCLEAWGSIALRTDRDGDVICKLRPDGISVQVLG